LNIESKITDIENITPNLNENNGLIWIPIEDDNRQIYKVLFNNNIKLPVLSIYEHDEKETSQKKEKKKRKNYFPRYKGQNGIINQIKSKAYFKSGWDHGHLSPQFAFMPSENAQKASNYLINIAPQDPHTNRCIWKDLEQKIRKDFTKRNVNGIITTGICHELHPSSTPIFPIPNCFWKISCYKSLDNRIVSNLNYHKNETIDSNSEEDKKKKKR